MPDHFDSRVVTRAQDGDRAAMTAVYEWFKPKVYRYLYYRLGDRFTAEDLTTEVFLRVIEGLPHYQQRGVPFQAWVFRIAHNQVVDYLRKLKAQQYVLLDENLEVDQERPEAAAGLSLTRDQLVHALKALTDEQCEVVVLRFVADMPIAQVAEAINKSESAVKALQARGLANLQRVLSEERVRL